VFYTRNGIFYNFSLITQPGIGPKLSPAYDLLATALVNPADDEYLALTLNGKKEKVNRSDFEAAFTISALDAKQQKNIFNKMLKVLPKWEEMIELSFLHNKMKEMYMKLIQERWKRLV
jgi:serine/threonine-protein kinase HipA